MKLNKHVMAMNLAAVIAFGAVAGIVAPSVSSESVVYAAEAATDGNAKTEEQKKADEAVKTKDAVVTPAATDPAAKALEGTTVKSNGDGTATFTAANKDADEIVIPASFKDAAGNEIKVTKIEAGAFNGVKAKTIDLSALELEELPSKLFDGAKKATTIKINAAKLKKGKINKKFLKGCKKLKKVKVVCSKKQFKKIKSRLEAAAKKSGYKKGTKIKRVSK